MLTEQTAVVETLGVDNVPIGFIAADDGRTLLAVAENEDGMLEIMTTPVTFVQQNSVISPSFIKAVDGSLILQPPVFQISLDSIVSTGIQQTAVLPVQSLQTETVIPSGIESIQNKEVDLEVVNGILPIDDSACMGEKETLPKKTDVIAVSDRNTQKRSPGRPRKDGNSSQHLASLKCDICGQSFNKQTLYRKHMDHHAEEKPHRCPKCPASFNIPSNFTLHMATHNIGEPKCPECGRKFARMASLKSHMLLHEKEENLFCTECEDAFATKAQLDAHLKLHGEKWATEDVRKCKLCNKQFVQPALYRLHIREHYRLQTKVVKQTKRGTKHKTMYKCTICLKSFQKPSQLMRHIRVHTGEKPFKCTVCNRAFTQKGSLQIHMWQHNGIRPHSCNLCNAKFSQKGNLNAHILRVHNAPEGEPIYRCTYCSCTFKKLGSLNGHMKRMHSNPVEDAPQKCDSSTEADMQATVNNVISQLASLESDVSNAADSANLGNSTTPTPTSMIKNDILQQALKNSGLPSKNKVQTSGETSVPKKTETRTTYVTLLDRAPDGTMRKYLTIKQRCVGNVRWYSCSFCHKEFKKPSDLIRHLRVHTQEKPFKCCFCFRSFALKSTMIAHERTHTGTKKYTCGSCDKTFSCHSSLSAHVRLHVKPHRCSECDKHFSSLAVLKSHMKSHDKEKPKISQEAEELVPQIVLQEPLVISDAGNKISVAHVQSKQNQVYNNTDVARPHKCWVCHAAFRKISHLKQHYRRHTGERPYKCPKCDRRFTSNSVLKSHLHTHEDARPYSCSVCNTKFSTQSSMKRHLVTHSNKRPFMCPYCHKTFKTSVNCRKHMKIHKHELAQRQLEQQKSSEQNTTKDVENKVTVTPLPENLTLAEDMEVSFQPQMAPDFTQAFSDQFQNITEEKEKSFLTSNTNNQSVVVNQDIVDTSNVVSSQTLHADETGTITLPNYSGDQTLTSESIRELEETLNQQLFNIGVNLGLGSNLSRQVDDPNTTTMETREQPVLNIIYENSKNIENSNPIFPAQFDSFDMGQITLQPDTEIDIGINSTNSTSMASILPRSAQEEQRLNPITTSDNLEDDRMKSNRHTIVSSPKQNCSDPLKPIQTTEKHLKVIAKADTTDNVEPQHIHSVVKEHKDITVDESGIVPLPFVPNFQSMTELQPQAKHQEMSSATNPNETINFTKCSSLLQCHMCGKQGFTTSGLKEHLKTHGGTKEYQCTECSLKFCTNGGLSRHLKMHSSKQQWKCPTCQKCFSSKVQLKLHSKIHNTNVVEPDSSQGESTIPLDANLSTMQSLDIKIGTDPSVSEKVLLDTVAEKEIMERLGVPTEQKEKKEYTNKCKYCPKTFRKPSDLIRHIRTHTGERPYKCEYCNKSFAVKCTLDSHVKVHTGKKTFCCHVCSSLFATKGSLKVHMRLHTGSKPFKCPMCDLRFRTSGHRKVHLLKHMREHKGTAKRKTKHVKVSAIAEVASNLEKSMQNTVQTSTINEEVPQNVEYPSIDTITIDTNALTNQLTFNTDGTILNNNSVLSINESNQLVANLHFLLANGLVTIQTDDSLQVSNVPNTEPNIIREENRITEFIPQASLPCNETSANHILIATQLPTQLNCSTNQSELQYHSKYELNPKNSADMKTVSNELSITDSGTVDNQILIATPLSSHLNLQTDQAVQLNNCMTVMQVGSTNPVNAKSEATTKKQAKGSQSKKECDICGKTFTKPYQVERHKRIHTGERPYKCDLCTKSFAQKSTLQMHQKHHTGDRPHPCPHCEYSFTQKGNLQTHLKRVHQLDILENKKLRKNQQVLSAKLNQDNLDDAKILNLDDISFVELLK